MKEQLQKNEDGDLQFKCIAQMAFSLSGSNFQRQVLSVVLLVFELRVFVAR